MKRFSSCLQSVRKSEDGAVLILVALAMVVLMGMTALAIDVGGLYHVRRQTVNAADAAVLAAVTENQEIGAERQARYYAEEKNNTNFEGIEFTYVDRNDTDSWIVTVLVSKQYNYTFGRVLGLETQDVLAIASSQKGPGNPLAPFGKIGYQCYCCVDLEDRDGECSCTETDNGTDDGNGDGTDDGTEDGNSGENENECSCYEGGFDDKVWKVQKEDGSCANTGDYIQLRYSDWDEGEFGSGCFHPIVLPGQQFGANTFRNDLAGGYEGSLSLLDPEAEEGAICHTEPGNMPEPTRDGLNDRLGTFSGDIITSLEELDDMENPYDYPLLVIVPLIEEPPGRLTGREELTIIGFASFLLVPDLDLLEFVDGGEVSGYLYEYLTYDELAALFDNDYVEGFIWRLVQDPQDAVNSLLDAFHN